VPGDPVEHLLAEVAEGRVAKIVRERGSLDHVEIAAAEFVQQPRGILIRGQPLGDGAGDLRDLEAVREPVVQQQS
jgi:hypothetical protein